MHLFVTLYPVNIQCWEVHPPQGSTIPRAEHANQSPDRKITAALSMKNGSNKAHYYIAPTHMMVDLSQPHLRRIKFRMTREKNNQRLER